MKIRLELWLESKGKKTLQGHASAEVPDGTPITKLMRDMLFKEWFAQALNLDEQRISDRCHD